MSEAARLEPSDEELLARHRIRIVREKVIDFGVGDDDAPVDFPLAQPGEQDLGADLVAEPLPADAVLLERRAQIGLAQPVAFGDAGNRAFQRRVIDLQRSLPCELDLRTLALRHAFATGKEPDGLAILALPSR